MIAYRELECGCEHSSLRGAGATSYDRIVVAESCTRDNHKKQLGVKAKKKKKGKRR